MITKVAVGTENTQFTGLYIYILYDFESDQTILYFELVIYCA